MDAILEEKLSVDDFWRVYVGEITPLEFMNRMYSPEIDACVEAYVNELPDLFGIVRRQSWRDSFEAPTQFRRGEVAAAICEKLEKTEAEWRPHLNQRPAPPEPVVAPPPQSEAPVPDESAPEEHGGQPAEQPAEQQVEQQAGQQAEQQVEQPVSPQADQHTDTGVAMPEPESASAASETAAPEASATEAEAAPAEEQQP